MCTCDFRLCLNLAYILRYLKIVNKYNSNVLILGLQKALNTFIYLVK